MKPITSEDKARYFAMYLRQQIDSFTTSPSGILSGVKITPPHYNGSEAIFVFDNYDIFPRNVGDYTIQLRPISSLNELEVAELAKMLIDDEKEHSVHRKFFDNVFVFEDDCAKTGHSYIEIHLTGGIDVGTIDINAPQQRSSCESASECILHAYQYLQSIGIAIPFYCNGQTYSVFDLVEAGIIKLIE